MSQTYNVAIYATRNRRAPIIGLINPNDWPRKAGFFRMAMAGQRMVTIYLAH
jgi:hypothetical protein